MSDFNTADTIQLIGKKRNPIELEQTQQSEPSEVIKDIIPEAEDLTAEDHYKSTIT